MTAKCESFEQAEVALKARLEDKSVSNNITTVQICIAGLLVVLSDSIPVYYDHDFVQAEAEELQTTCSELRIRLASEEVGTRHWHVITE